MKAVSTEDREQWIKELGGHSGWWHESNATAILKVLARLTALGVSEMEARDIIEDAASAIRSEYGD